VYCSVHYIWDLKLRTWVFRESDLSKSVLFYCYFNLNGKEAAWPYLIFIKNIQKSPLIHQCVCVVAVGGFPWPQLVPKPVCTVFPTSTCHNNKS
jgi:hypothetical protein